MGKIQYLGTIYFLSYLLPLLLDFIVSININSLLTSILSLISVCMKFPKNSLDLILSYTQLGNYVLLISGVCFCKTLYELITTGEICTSK